jgi:hypothetical protein
MTLHRAAFDPPAARLAVVARSLPETDILRPLWDAGEDAWLREDARFRPTPWGRWVLADHWLVNDELVRQLRAAEHPELSLAEQLTILAKLMRRPTAFCEGDPRLRVDGDRVRLHPSELTNEPLLEQVGESEQYTTHLPVLSLKAAAASEPAGEWGPDSEPQQVRALGWVRVDTRPLNRRMFVAQVRGQSMDAGHRPIEDGDRVIFSYTFHKGIAYDAGSTEPTVLVRGEFSDPESGAAYAVKRWVRDSDEVRLRSTNPDKERYPDIVVPAADADHIRIVATFDRVLKPADYARQPKPRTPQGRRRLEGHLARAEAAERMEARARAFFEGRPREGSEGEDDSYLGARIVCLPADAGGTCLELGPLPHLDRVVKRLRALADDWESVVLAGNARERAVRVPVAPGGGPWRWEAVGFEGDEEIGMPACDAAALPKDAATVFRVDAGGIGNLVATRALSPGQHYRIVGPPDLASPSEASPLVAGWWMWDLALENEPAELVLAGLGALGLSLGEPAPSLEWALVPPGVWRRTPSAQSYAVGNAGAEVFLRARGLPGDEPAVLFVHGPGGGEQVPIEGADALVSLGAPTAGRWGCELLHPRVAVPPATLFFEVVAEPPVLPGAACELRAGEQPLEDGSEVDLHANPALVVCAPPGWPVTLRWRGLADVDLGRVHADADGQVDVGLALPALRERASHARLATLVVDVGELGARSLRHVRRAATDDLVAAVTVLWSKVATTVRASPGEWALLEGLWFRKLTEQLGYGMHPVPPMSDTEFGLWQLTVDEPAEAGISRTAVRVLVLTVAVSETLASSGDILDRVCRAVGVREAIVSDGVNWSLYRRGVRLARRVWNMDEIVGSGALAAWLAEFAEEAQ